MPFIYELFISNGRGDHVYTFIRPSKEHIKKIIRGAARPAGGFVVNIPPSYVQHKTTICGNLLIPSQ